MLLCYKKLESAWNYELEYLDISSIGVIIEGVIDFNSFSSQFKMLLDNNSKVFSVTKTSIFLTNNMTFREFRQFKKKFEDFHYEVYSIFVKHSYFFGLATKINSQIRSTYKFQEKLFYLLHQPQNITSNFPLIKNATDIKIIPTTPPNCFYGFSDFTDLLQAYSILIENETNWPIFALTDQDLKLFKKSENKQLKLFKERELIKAKNVSLAERIKNNYPPFCPSKYFYYVGFIEKVVPSPQRMKNVDELFLVKEINDVQISHVYHDENGTFYLRTFLGFESEFRCLQVFDYFQKVEEKTDLFVDVIMISESREIKFKVSHNLYYLEFPINGGFDRSIIFSMNCIEFFETSSSAFYSFDNENDFNEAFQILNDTIDNSIKKLSIFDLRTVDRDQFNDKFEPNLAARMLKTKFFYFVFALKFGNVADLKPILKAAKFIESNVGYRARCNGMKYFLYGFACSDDRDKAYSLMRKEQNSNSILCYYPQKVDESLDSELFMAMLNERKSVSAKKAQTESDAAAVHKAESEKKGNSKDTKDTMKEKNDKSNKDSKNVQKEPSKQNSQNVSKAKSVQDNTKFKSTQNNIENASKDKNAQNNQQNKNKTTKDKNTQIPSKDKNAQIPSKDKNTQIPSKDKNAQIPSKDKNAQIPSKDKNTQEDKNAQSSSINKAQSSESLSKDSGQPKSLPLSSTGSSSEVQSKKLVGPEFFSPSQNLIYFYFLEKEKARKISPGKQVKLTLFGVKKCKDIQRYKKISDMKDSLYFTFFGFEKYDELKAGIEAIQMKTFSDGPINIYEFTNAYQKYLQNPNGYDKEDLEQEQFLQALLKEKSASQPLISQGKSDTKKSQINKIEVNSYRDICNQSVDFYCFSELSVPKTIQFEIKKSLSKMKSIKNIIKDIVPHYLVYEPYTFIFVDSKDQVNDTIFRNVFASHKIAVTDIEYDTDFEHLHYLEFEEKVLPLSTLKKFLYFLDLLGEVKEVRRNVFHLGKIVTMFFFDSPRKEYVLNLIEKSLIEENVLFNLKKFSLKNSIYFNEEVMLQNKDDFDIIVNEIKSFGLKPISIERNKLILIKKTVLSNNLFQRFSFICFNSEKEKMEALNHINPIVLKYRNNVLCLNASLHYVKIDPSKCFPQIIINPQVLLINAMNAMSGIADFQQNVFSIECPIELTYIGFSSKKLMYFYNKVLNFRLNYISLFPGASFFKPDENMFYIRYKINIDKKLEDIFGDDVMLKIDETQRNCTVFEKEIQVLTYIGFKEKSDRDYVANALSEFLLKNNDALVFSIIDFDQDIEIYDDYDQMTSECIFNLINDRILVQ